MSYSIIHTGSHCLAIQEFSSIVLVYVNHALALLFLFFYNVRIYCTENTTAHKMKNVSITELRANLLKYLKIAQHGEQINVTSKGTLLATLTPPVSQQSFAKDKLRELAKTAVLDDVLSPIEDAWDAMK
jgi:prevent-host-death family protein